MLSSKGENPETLIEPLTKFLLSYLLNLACISILSSKGKVCCNSYLDFRLHWSSLLNADPFGQISLLAFVIQCLYRPRIGQYPMILVLLFDVSEFAFNKIFIKKLLQII